jgi:phenylpropionate dioxygenase-like ring-hydroxylating dioxygenase large terminal subunit
MLDDTPEILLKSVVAGSTTRVEDAATLPPAAYMSQAFFDLEKERIFEKQWHCVGHLSQIEKVGDYFTVDLMGERIIIVRAADRIRALSGVCLHRWAPVATGSGNVKLFSCPFHKWGYALDGQLLGAPFMEQAAEFEPKACRLPEIRSEIVAGLGLIFITFNPEAEPIGPKLQDLADNLAPLGVTDYVVVAAREYDNKFNWKIQVETYMECYHHIGAHRESIEPTSPGHLSWCDEDKPGWTMCHAGVKPDLPADHPDGESFGLVLVYPLTMIGITSKMMDIQILVPVGPNRTKSTWIYLMKRDEAMAPDKDEKLAKRLERMDEINNEDLAVNDMQQYGAGSHLAEPGRFSHLEACSWHLAEYVRRHVG